MSAGSGGVRLDPVVARSDTAPDAETGGAAPASTPPPPPADGEYLSSRWQPSDWDGLLARPPGLPAPSTTHRETSNGWHGADSAASGSGTSVGTGWPVPQGYTSLTVARGPDAPPSAPVMTALRTTDAEVDDPPSPTDVTGPQAPGDLSDAAPPTAAGLLGAAPAVATGLGTRPAARVDVDRRPSTDPDGGPAEPAPSVPTTAKQSWDVDASAGPLATRAEPTVEPDFVDGGDHALVTAGSAGAERRHATLLESWSLRRLVTVSGAVLVTTVLSAYLVSAAQPTVYGAQADVLYEATGSTQESERVLATQEVLLGSRGVLAPVADRFDVSLRDLTESQDVEQIAGSQVLRTLVRNEDPDLAVQLAQGIADSYVESVSSSAGDTGPEQERRIREEITDLSVNAAAGRARLEELAEARAAAGGVLAATPEERQLQVQDTALAQRIDALQAQLTQIIVERDNASRARVLTPAYLLDEPVGPAPLRAAAAGAMVGLVLAAALLALGLRGRGLFALGA